MFLIMNAGLAVFAITLFLVLILCQNVIKSWSEEAHEKSLQIKSLRTVQWLILESLIRIAYISVALNLFSLVFTDGWFLFVVAVISMVAWAIICLMATASSANLPYIIAVAEEAHNRHWDPSDRIH